MKDEEKKLTLDELPDMGSEPEKFKAPSRKKKLLEPRLENFKKLNESEKLNAYTERWVFDRPVRKWGWLVCLLLLLGLEKSDRMKDYTANRARLRAETDGMSEIVAGLMPMEELFAHPLWLALLIPLFFRFSKSEGLFFEIYFNGINTVQKVIHGSPDKLGRVFIKWDEMIEVRKIIVDKLEVLEILDAKGPRAQLIWDIDLMKKKVVSNILKRLVHPTNPFRLFIEKEVA